MFTKVLSLLMVMVLISDVIHACLLMERPRRMTDVELMDRFNVLVYGQYVDTKILDYQTEGKFIVECVLKNDNPEKRIPGEITIKNAVSMIAGCDTTRVSPGEIYLLGLKREGDDFLIDRYPLHNSAIHPSRWNLKAAGGLCSVDRVVMAGGKSLKSSKVCYSMYKTLKRNKRNGVCFCPRTSSNNESTQP